MFEMILDISHNLNNIKLNEFMSIVQKVMLVLGHFYVFVAEFQHTSSSCASSFPPFSS